MNKNNTLRRVAMGRIAMAGGLLLGMAPTAAMASGFYIVEQSAKATGRAYSGEVADTGAESLWWNPAAIAGKKGLQVHASASGILAKADINNVSTLIVRPGSAPAAVGGDQVSSDPIDKGLVPTMGLAYGLNDKIALGLAITAPYNFTTNYPSTSWARYSALKTSLRTIDIQPTLAITPLDGLRLGVGVNIEYSKAELGNALPNLAAGLPDGSQKLEGDGWDVGFSAGMQFQRGPVSIGASYKSSVKHTLNGSVVIAGLLGPIAPNNGTISTTATFSTPWQAVFGARYAITPAITLNAQATAVGWSKFDAIALGAPLNTALPQKYRDSWTFAGGFDIAVSERTTLRAGIARDQSPVRNDYRDARVPDANRWVFAVGGSYAVTPRLKLDLGANYLKLDDAQINRPTAAYVGTPAQTLFAVNGTMTNANVLILAAGVRYGL